MHHLAIMKKSWKLIPKILSGEKTIESRWYKSRIAPWNKIAAGDIVYFKDGGEPVVAQAEVEHVLQFENYTDNQLQHLVTTYGGAGKICFHSPMEQVITWAKTKRYCILIFLKRPQSIEPFQINKKGFGNASAWITVPTIDSIKAP